MKGLEQIPWMPLRVSPSDQPPVFLLSYFTTTTDSYSLTVTDLQSLWVDSANRNDISERAMQDKCVVDVSQSSNLSVLLGKLSDSLNQNELPEGTKLDAMRCEENLRITLSLPLSTNSMPLVWIFRLQSTPSPNFRRDIFLGTLGIIDALQSQISALQALASEKDYHIHAMQDVIQECHANLYAPRRYRASFGKFDAERWLQSWKNSKTATCNASEVYFRSARECSEWWGWCADGGWEITHRDFNDIQVNGRLTHASQHNPEMPRTASKRTYSASSSSSETPVRREDRKGKRSRQRWQGEDEDNESSSGNERQIRSLIGGRRLRRDDKDSDSADERSRNLVNSMKDSRRMVSKVSRQGRKQYADASTASSSDSESESQSSRMIIGGRRGQSQISPPPGSSQTAAEESSLKQPSSSDEKDALSHSPGSSAHGVIGGGITGGSRSRSSRRATPTASDMQTKGTSISPVPIPQEGPPQKYAEPSIKSSQSSPARNQEDMATERQNLLDTQLQTRKRMPVRRRF
ncbi:XRCC4-like factor-domain-containing protein [Lipomyces kononenkoae]|uniref:XRCC4-like factor-domain-containing protein n=1 Tax=Lipomyces kononenkoae TaxID=34357 RepID=A0ACC3SWB1_LIPKO